jgi:hypothetical protein
MACCSVSDFARKALVDSLGGNHQCYEAGHFSHGVADS